MKTRLNLAISEDVKKKIELLQIEIGADSMSEVIRRAIDAFDLIVKEQKLGNHIEIRRRESLPTRIHVL